MCKYGYEKNIKCIHTSWLHWNCSLRFIEGLKIQQDMKCAKFLEMYRIFWKCTQFLEMCRIFGNVQKFLDLYRIFGNVHNFLKCTQFLAQCASIKQEM